MTGLRFTTWRKRATHPNPSAGNHPVPSSRQLLLRSDTMQLCLAQRWNPPRPLSAHSDFSEPDNGRTSAPRVPRSTLSSTLRSGLRVHEVASGHFLLIAASHTVPNTVGHGYLIKTFQISIRHSHLPGFKLAGAVADFHLSPLGV